MLPCFLATIFNYDSDVASPNPTFTLWICHNQLILNAIIGFAFVNLVTFITPSTSFCVAWSTLEKTYPSPSHGRIMEFCGRLTNLFQLILGK